MASQYATPFKGETQEDKKHRLIKGMRFLVKRNPKKYRMVTDGSGNLILEERDSQINIGGSVYWPVQAIRVHKPTENVTRQIGF